ncbi:MAG: Carboxymethylenebutenolidase [Bacteroidota bacterium]|jgi:4,5-DOPA dioxygenase extradiol
MKRITFIKKSILALGMGISLYPKAISKTFKMTKKQFKQPALFLSHGTMYEAFRSDDLKRDFQKIRAEHLQTLPDAIVLFSGHWQTKDISVTTAPQMRQMDEGFPPEFWANYTTSGSPDLAHRIIAMLNENGIKTSAEPHRELDHGALIPLLLLFPNDKIPVVQVSQQYQLDPNFHKQMAAILSPLRHENILFIGSGGLVHNRNFIAKMSGHSLAPDDWAKQFDDYITTAFADKSDTNYADKSINAYHHALFNQSHPTSEHYLPLVFASALGATPTKIYEAFQWRNLSMSAFKFE